ncbi:MAG TPA: DNA polymerase III subunit gamma/tau [Candidatus Saccharibacteria bacterium]|nr:DNA polymerase III subunit gamma/tau [Candidatus Saccharibacteria bacterium]
MSKALYRKYRSKTLDEVIGQKHITDILARAIATDRVSHAYLLTGPRGVGKTSIARILAHEINKLAYNDDETHLDIIEIDAASNNGVEDVRDLREKVQIAPVSASKKIYIIDEVHMLSKPAFNALLKTLEEPPAHVVFILATTDIERLPETIISRTQRFSFRPISTNDATEHLKKIAKLEKIKASDSALQLIAERGDGSFRDSISLLDQLASLADEKEGITTDLIESTLGLAPTTVVDKILDSVEARDVPTLVKLLDDTFNEGISGAVLASQLTARVRSLVVTKPQLIPLLDSLLDVSKSSQPQLKLLSVLGLAASPKQSTKTAALIAPMPGISASIKELEKQAVKKNPTNTHTPAESNDKSTNNNPKITTASKFDWDKLIEYTRQKYVALYSVLSKCKFELEGKDLTIYTSSKFYKKKLDDTKYSPLLYSCLNDLGFFELTIHTIPTGLPPQDSQAAAVAVIMGGGEEVSLETA